jgi:hypothetical protein
VGLETHCVLAVRCRNLQLMRHQELLPLFANAIALEIVHLRWIMLMKWTCRGCHATNMQCDCKHGWVKRLL